MLRRSQSILCSLQFLLRMLGILWKSSWIEHLHYCFQKFRRIRLSNTVGSLELR
ncbi:hypothetical protein Golob_010999 [Gossypium lobatum]|uniref:Uncharacterized protein n=1 Tax=Gossypium lobatum TaxID=34289 RepID=A0A7J8MN58_9ROSI|nr:hypothetical protein [Gossypium lobatum]